MFLYMVSKTTSRLSDMGARRIFFPGSGKFIGIARIFSGVQLFFSKTVQDLFFVLVHVAVKMQTKTTK